MTAEDVSQVIFILAVLALILMCARAIGHDKRRRK